MIINASPKQYHTDDFGPVPTASKSILAKMLRKTPRHAWAEHPRLNPNWEVDKDRKFDFGSAFHDYYLDSAKHIVAVEASDYRGKEAKATRAAALQEHLTPVLEKDLGRIMIMAANLDVQFPALKALPIREQTILFEWNGVNCRTKPDLIDPEHNTIYDIKTTADASEHAWQKTLYNTDAHMSAALYIMGARMHFVDSLWNYVFVVIEDQPPHCAACYRLSLRGMELGAIRVHRALRRWQSCLASNRWPGYGSTIQDLRPPAWIEYDEEEDSVDVERAGSDDGLLAMMIDWQAPP